MPASVEFLNELERAFKRGDINEIISLGVRMLHMGWFGRMDWFLDRFNSILKDLSSEQLEVLNRERFPNLFYVVMYVIRDMRPKKALPYIRSKHNLIERRIFHEYLGNHPRAYFYLRRGEKEMGLGGFWADIRKFYFRLYRGLRINVGDVENLQTSEEELEFIAQVITKNYTIGLYHLLVGDISLNAFNRIKKAVMFGLSENYDHTTSRLLQVFIPLSVMIGKEGVTRNLLNAAISTARTEHNRYMYEWFSLYKIALEPWDVDRYEELLKRKIRFYYQKGYKGHETLARTILYLLEPKASRHLRRIKDLRDKYWHHHTVRFAEALTGQRLR
jgi:hypothetical protein